MTGAYATLVDISLWILFILGILLIIVPVLIGLATRSLGGSIQSIEDGKLWFYRNGLTLLIGIAALFAFFFGASIR